MRAIVALKQQIMTCLTRAGLVVWPLHRTRPDMYAMLIIACNRLSPSRPKAAMQMLDNSLRYIRVNHGSDKDTPKCLELMDKEKIRAAALLIAQDGCCPVCNAKWKPEEYDTCDKIFRSKLNLSHNPPHCDTFEVNPSRCQREDAISLPQNDTIKA